MEITPDVVHDKKSQLKDQRDEQDEYKKLIESPKEMLEEGESWQKFFDESCSDSRATLTRNQVTCGDF